MHGVGPTSVRYFILILVILQSGIAMAAPVTIPGTRVTMDAPPSFSLAADFPGFVSRDLQATISVEELPSSFVEVSAEYDDDALERQGIAVLARTTLERDGLRSILIEGEQSIRKRKISKLMLLTGDVGESLLITATWFSSDQKKVGAALRRSLREAEWDASIALDHFGGLGFRLKDIPGLNVATRASNSIIFTHGGRLPDRFYTGAMLVVGWSKGDVKTVTNRKLFAHQQFENIRLLNDAKIDETEYLELDGRTAIEVTGSGQHKHLGYDLNVYQIIVPYDTRFLMAQGFAGGNEPLEVFEKFRAVMSSLTTD